MGLSDILSNKGVLLAIIYPNWFLKISFFTGGWEFFFKQEIYSLLVLTPIVLLSQFLFFGLDFSCFLIHLVIVVTTLKYLAGGICISDKKLVGKTVIITGANTGIGKETARDLYVRGARVIMACRSAKRAEEAKSDILTTRGSGSVEVRVLDVSDMESVRSFAAGIKKDNINIDILINNAGIMVKDYAESVDGFEMTMASNHLGHFLLTNLLLPQLKHGSEARIVNVSSLGHHLAKLDLNDLNMKKQFNGFTQYCNTKLANVLFSRELARQLRDANIKVFAPHPGGVQTEILRRVDGQWSVFLLHCVTRLVFKTAAEGAQTTLYCALEAEQHPNMYFSECAVGWSSTDAKSDALAQQLWKVSGKLVKLD